ncbi:hypothetical protein NDU88_008927 [Pleurodeles waltl]|uniref:Uncharacterized protein n=1 Tax=Pleurodeles waltl TaxID=8319 RepID=A0AAV7RW75_PLEWA|nr:hypothetical protein NDU88_008927 [Pleurodeles waltl]
MNVKALYNGAVERYDNWTTVWGEGPRPPGAQSGRSGNPTAALSKSIATNSGALNKGLRRGRKRPPPLTATPPLFRPHRRGNVGRKRKGRGQEEEDVQTTIDASSSKLRTTRGDRSPERRDPPALTLQRPSYEGKQRGDRSSERRDPRPWTHEQLARQRPPPATTSYLHPKGEGHRASQQAPKALAAATPSSRHTADASIRLRPWGVR